MENKREIYLSLGEIKDTNSKREIIEIQDLWPSIALAGLKTPLIVKNVDGEWQLESGSRRLAALKYLKQNNISPPGLEDFSKIPCWDDSGNELDPDLARLVTNVQKELPPSARGKALRDLATNPDTPTPIGILSKAIGIPEAKVMLLIDLANASPEIQKKVDRGELCLSAFSRLRTAPKEVVEEITEQEGRVTVEKTNRIIKRANASNDALIQFEEQTTVQMLNDIFQKLDGIVHEQRLGAREKFLVDKILMLLQERTNGNN